MAKGDGMGPAGNPMMNNNRALSPSMAYGQLKKRGSGGMQQRPSAANVLRSSPMGPSAPNGNTGFTGIGMPGQMKPMPQSPMMPSPLGQLGRMPQMPIPNQMPTGNTGVTGGMFPSGINMPSNGNTGFTGIGTGGIAPSPYALNGMLNIDRYMR